MRPEPNARYEFAGERWQGRQGWQTRAHYLKVRGQADRDRIRRQREHLAVLVPLTNPLVGG